MRSDRGQCGLHRDATEPRCEPCGSIHRRKTVAGRAAPAGSWGRRAVRPTPYASRSGLSRGVKVGRVSVCGLRTGSGREPAGPAEAVCPSTVDPVMA